MARKPRTPAGRGATTKPGKTSRRRGISALAVVIFLLVAGLGAGVAWLSLTYEPPLRPGMPGNELVVALDDAATAPAADSDRQAAPATPAPAPTEQTAAAPATAPTDQPPAAPADRAAGAPPAAETPTTTATDQTAAASADETAPAAPTDQAAPAAPADQTAAAAPADQAPPAPAEQAAAAPAPAPPSTPAPAGLPQRQPVGEQQAMQLKVPPPSPGVRPRVAVVLTGLGLSKAQTAAAVQALPANVTFAFSPYGSELQDWADQARAAGHEVLLELPMEPNGFPQDDPGPHTLLTSLTEAENVERMTWVLDRFTGYVGVTSQIGGRFTTQPEALRPILAELKKRGLLFLDTRTSPDSAAPDLAVETGLAHASNDVFLNEPTAARATIQAGLAKLEQLARERGSAVGIGHPFPVTMELLAAWSRDLEGRGIELLPLSALAHLPEAQ